MIKFYLSGVISFIRHFYYSLGLARKLQICMKYVIHRDIHCLYFSWNFTGGCSKYNIITL